MPYEGSIIDRAIGVLKLAPERWVDGVAMTSLLGFAPPYRLRVCKQLRRAHAEGFLVRRPVHASSTNPRRFEYQLPSDIDERIANAERACRDAKAEAIRRGHERRKRAACGELAEVSYG